MITEGANGNSECQGPDPDLNTDYIAWLADNGGAQATDLCGNVTWSNTPGQWTGGCVNTIDVVFTATDDCDNSSTITLTFTIEDTTPPVITEGANGNSECQGPDPDLNTDYIAWLANNGGATATDICNGIVNWTNTPGQWTGGCVNTIDVVFTATDDCDNSSTITLTFTIEDTTPPVITEGANGNSECQGPDPDLNTDYIAWLADNGGAQATDLCGNVTWSNTPGQWSGGCVNAIDVVFTATDDCDNSSDHHPDLHYRGYYATGDRGWC